MGAKWGAKRETNPTKLPLNLCLCLYTSVYVCVCWKVYICICVNMCSTYFAKNKHSLKLYKQSHPKFVSSFRLFFYFSVDFGSNTWVLHLANVKVVSGRRDISFMYFKFICLFINCITFISSFWPRALGWFSTRIWYGSCVKLFRKVNYDFFLFHVGCMCVLKKAYNNLRVRQDL